MTKCQSCGSETAVGRPRCSVCGAQQLTIGAEQDQDSKEFQSLGAIKLKRAKRTSDGAIEASESAEPSPLPTAAASAPLVEAVAGQPFAGLISHQAPIPGVSEFQDDGASILIGAPPLGSATLLAPEIVPSFSSDRTGLIGALSYGLQAPRVASNQRRSLKRMSTELAKFRKQEQEVLAALGRAARIHDLAPPDCQELVEASQEQEMSSLEHRLKTDEVQQEHQAADRAFQAARQKNAIKLADLERKHERLVEKLEALNESIVSTEARLEELQERERQLRAEGQAGGSEAEATERVREFESLKAVRKLAEIELEAFQDQAQAAQRPVSRIRDEMASVRGEIRRDEQRLSAVESQAKVAEISGQRREEFTTRNVAEIDEEIGRAITRSAGQSSSLRQLLTSIETCRRRAEHWEQAISDQQNALDIFDEKRARKGFWLMIGGLMGLLLLLLGGSELIRRLLLNSEG